MVSTTSSRRLRTTAGRRNQVVLWRAAGRPEAGEAKKAAGLPNECRVRRCALFLPRLIRLFLRSPCLIGVPRPRTLPPNTRRERARGIMKKLLLPVSAAALVTIAAVATLPANTAEAQGPPHGHMLVLHLEVELIGGVPHAVGFHRCVDLAGGRNVPLNAHHAHIHTGAAGGALQSAGHATVPTAPLTGWANCAELEAELAEGPIPVGPPPA
jgi:hypothetical protein